MDGFDRRTPGDADGSAPSEHVTSNGPGTGQRAKARDSLLLVAQCRLGEQRTVHEVRVRNLSEGGLMIELDTPADVGTRVWLDLRGIGEIVGKVAWCAAGRMGIALDTPIDPKKARKPVGGGAKTGLLGL
ncbi:PilZ domain-containing protein [Sphingomonas sp. Leaf38]|uniref:PilZ domain-containing protein n=1 Tax=Sphingomonas sp. Leaf38 TaxID=1736217 RepID=UPI000A527EF6|nr:PilZ domain-containing protein [Sphingomonas sp. Leaf38]